MDALLGGARLIEVSAGNISYSFQSHGFPQAARPLIETCQSATTPTPAPRPTLTPVTKPVVDAGVMEFAGACSALMSEDESAPEWSFEDWVVRITGLEAPPVLADFWASTVGMYAYQLDVVDRNIETVGPNEQTLDASDRQRRLIARMDPDLRQVLLDSWCLTATEVALADRIEEAWLLLETGLEASSESVQNFGALCRATKITSPTFDTVDAIPRHLLYWWRQLAPPPELVDYHEAVADYYSAWIESGDPTTVPFEVDRALDGNTLEMLI